MDLPCSVEDFVPGMGVPGLTVGTSPKFGLLWFAECNKGAGTLLSTRLELKHHFPFGKGKKTCNVFPRDSSA